jgi:hypothetical protein
MQINYELDELELQVRQKIESELRITKIPYLLEGDQLLINKADERAVDKIISQLGTVHNPGATLMSPPDFVDNQPFYRPYRSPAPSPQKLSPIDDFALRNLKQKEGSLKNDNGGWITTVGGLLGAAFGVLIVIAAFISPENEGRIYIFLPAIIFGALGLFLGSGIESVIRKLSGK